MSDVDIFDLDMVPDPEAFPFDEDEPPLERARKIELQSRIRTSRLRIKAREKNDIKLDELNEIFPRLPNKRESVHIVSSGNFDFWTFIPLLLERLGGHVDEAYISTWTMSRNHVLDMLDLLDSGAFGTLTILTGIYFKTRETSVYAQLVEGLAKRKARWVGFRNHAKVTLLRNKTHNLALEGSANLTANPRVEQFVLTNHEALYQFHRDWMEEAVAKYLER